ncbi:MAG: PD-(D/E)XK nuclease family protein [Desulfovibrio sp.]|nr:PD-(D/E)XK nuclease family protein [Desulfovibrio sp.]
MLPFAQLAAQWCASVTSTPYAMANPLDEVFYLRECVTELAGEDRSLAAHFAGMDMARFMPWGIRLASLIDDLFLQAIEPRDLESPEDEAEPLAAALLAALGRISLLYRQKLEAARPELLTKGLECMIAAEHAAEIPPYLLPTAGRPVIIAGFSVLNGAENRLFHSLWQAGAEICVHAASDLGDSAAQPLAEWVNNWKAGITSEGESLGGQPEYSFYAAYDAHSQIEQMARDIGSDAEAGSGASTAIVLPGAELLMPVLHHMPPGPVNISMGYPLKRAQLRSFLDDLFQLQLHRQGNGNFYWRDLLRLFGQPYLATLEAGEGGEARLGASLWQLGRLIRRNGAKYVNLEELKGELKITPEERAFLEEALAALVDGFATVNTTASLAKSLEKICSLLIRHGKKSWEHFHLDAEALSRLQNRILPVLLANPVSSERFSLQSLYRLLDILLENERIPFEAEPLVGRQILGLFETRLLHFDNIYILDASDDRLPGSKSQDPLLPDALRARAGLPDARVREQIMAYNLFRLFAGAKRVRFYWAEGGALSDSASGKRFRSRYVEQLIWQEEQKRSQILKEGEGPLQSAQSMAALNIRSPGPVRRSDRLSAAMDKLLSSPLSATMLNSYLACPANFVFSRLMRLRPLEEVNEGEDYAEAGICIHATLAEILEPWIGREVTLANIGRQEIKKVFNDKISELGMTARMPVDSWLVFEYAGLKRLEKYFQNQKEATFINGLETAMSTDLALDGRQYRFEGKLDRLDTRNGEKLVLDYKTGTIHKPEAGLWGNRDFFAALAEYLESHPGDFDSEGDELLAQMRVKLPDLQLGIYLLLSGAANAAYVDLKNSGREIPFFDPGKDGKLEEVLESCKIALRFILAHMQRTPLFQAVEGRCATCDHASVCQV